MPQSYKTSSDISESVFLKLDENNQLKQATSKTDKIIGVSDSVDTIDGDVADVFLNGERTEIRAGGTFAAGDLLTADANGYAVVAGYGDNIGAIALNSAVAGDLVDVIVCIQRHYEAPKE